MRISPVSAICARVGDWGRIDHRRGRDDHWGGRDDWSGDDHGGGYGGGYSGSTHYYYSTGGASDWGEDISENAKIVL